MEEEHFKLPPLAHLGWAFLLAWVFCVFYTTAAGSINDGPISTDAAPALGQMLFYGIMPLASSVATLAVIVLVEPRIGAPTEHRSLFAIAPVLTAVSTPLMFITLNDPAADALLFTAGSLATGIGSALLWVMWGEYYTVIPRDEAEGLAPLSAVLGAGLVIIVSATTGWVPIALATLFPLLSGLCLRQAWTADCSRAETILVQAARRNQQGHRSLAGLGRTGFGIMAVFSIVSVAGMLLEGRSTGAILQGILVFSALMMALVALAAISGPRRISLPFLYRWMCPVLVAGFCAVVLFGEVGAVVALASSVGGRFTFCLIAQLYFANYAASGRATPTQSVSLGWLFVHLGDLVGYTAFLLVTPLLNTLPNGMTWVCAVCIVALVTVTMFVLNDRSSFHRPLPIGQDEEKSLRIAAGHAPVLPLSVSSVGKSDAAARSSARDTTEPRGRGEISDSREDEAGAGTSTELGDGTVLEASIEANSVPDSNLADAVAALAAEHKLTPRETEVFALLAQGRSIPYIRDELIISRETAATHAKHIYAKLGVHSRQELIDLVRQ